MLRYLVTDLSRFFLVYDLTRNEEAEVEKRFEADDTLFVYQDGSARYVDETEVVPPDEDGELADPENFQLEAVRCGSVATAHGEEEEEEDLEFVEAGVIQDEKDWLD